MPVLLTVPCKVIVAAGALAENDASGALLENVSAFREGLPDRPNISNALCFDIVVTFTVVTT